MTQFLCDTDHPIGHLHTEKLISQMTEKEQKYAAYRMLAAWAGFPIILKQVSREATDIFNFLDEFLKTVTGEEINDAIACADKNDKEKMSLKYAIEYAVTFFTNAGNYLGFGDLKFIPRVSLEDLEKLSEKRGNSSELLKKCAKEIYDTTTPGCQQLGFHPHGRTAYYEPVDFTEEEQKGIDRILVEKKIYIQNTNIHRESDRYNVVKFSIDVDEKGEKIGEYNGKPVYLTKGLFSKELKNVAKYLEKAIEYAANDTEKELLKLLIESFQTGDLSKHIESSKLWVKDIDPNVEADLGFIESYRDPSGVRTEFESFVAAIDHKESECLRKFVNSSEVVLKEMPYPKEYERATFSPPSYNAINILTFATTMLPVGINIPNYDEIRMEIGFKNFSLSNVMFSVPIKRTSLKYIPEEYKDRYMRMFPDVRKIGVAIHELYGHGSGKLFSEEDVKSQNIPDLLSPGRYVKTFYPQGLSYNKAFGSIGTSFEECRAEATSLFLSYTDTVMDIFEIDKKDRHDFQLCSAYSMLNLGLKSLNNYSLETSQWKQAHAQGRFAILRACIMWGKGAVTVTSNSDEIIINIDENRLDDVHDAVAILLNHLNYYKAACLPEQAFEFYNGITGLTPFWVDISKKIKEKKEPRSINLGAVVRKDEKGVRIETIGEGKDATVADIIQTFLGNIHAANN